MRATVQARFTLAVIGLLGGLPAAFSAPLTLQCKDLDAEREPRRIAALGGGMVKRVDARTLRVQARANTLKFVDDKSEGGRRYLFCDRKEGDVLLGHIEEDYRSGTLVDEASGKQLPAGAAVLFSADRHGYPAEASGDDLDGSAYLPGGAVDG